MKLILFLALSAGLLSAQCSSTSPCYQLSISNPNALPATLTLFRCMGSTTTCSQTALSDAINQETLNGCSQVNSTWSCVSFSESVTPELYNDPVSYGALMNYAAVTSTAGGVSAATPILTFQIPFPIPQAPTLTGSSGLTFTGTAGPQ